MGLLRVKKRGRRDGGGGRWKDAGDCSWLIKVRGGQDAGDLWQCESEVVQHLACEGNTFPFIQEQSWVFQIAWGFRSMFFALEASDDIPSVTARSISLSYDLQRGL